MTADQLAAFESDIAAEFNAGKIRAPVHLESGNEAALIRVFEKVKPEDWVCCSWRSHLKCLLKGVPPEVLKADIMAGRSISLCFPEQRVISSAIVGGILPIALGIAWSIKRAGGSEVVHCFVGDMTSRTGIFHECAEYAGGFDLPIRWIIEDNNLSVCTPTSEVWGSELFVKNLVGYAYSSSFPHAGAGKRIQF